jgi:glycosyltransferase involved in cell wall biosynthesis
MHVACLPFPSPQGTQAAISAMLEALRDAGRDVPLLCYPHGDARIESRVSLVRLAMPALTRTLRSGPSLSKIALDVGMIRAIRRQPRGGVYFCHHVEAAWAARLAGRDYVYVAHTALEDELATYFPRARSSWSTPISHAGELLDAFAIEGAIRCAAVSPALGQRLAARHGRPFDYLPVPWPLGETLPREEVRRALGVGDDTLVVLYTGNLDGYQNWEEALDVVKLLRDEGTDARLLVATDSGPGPLRERARAIGLEALTVRGLSSEDDRRLVHAAADAAIVPRRSPGGVPIKLLDALARGVPVVTTTAGTAGLPLGGAVAIGASTRELAEACRLVGREREAWAPRGRTFLREHHAAGVFLDAYARLLAQV